MIKKLNASIGYYHQMILWAITLPLINLLFKQISKESKHGMTAVLMDSMSDLRIKACIGDAGRTFGIYCVFPFTLLAWKRQQLWCKKVFLPLYAEVVKDHAGEEHDELIDSFLQGMDERLNESLWS